MDMTSETILRIGDWRVDPRLGQIARGAEVVRVEARTMRLLLCLARRAGEVVSIDELLDEVWSGVVVTPDSVYQGVALLRRQLGDDPKRPSYIANVPRLGYRMVATVEPWVDEPEASAPQPAITIEEPPTLAAEAAPRPPRRTATVLLTAAALVIAIGLTIFLTHANVASGGRSMAPQPLTSSIAVLPFLDLTEAMNQEFLVDSITENLIDQLSKDQSLRVPPLRSSFYFKDRQTTIGVVARTLGVAYVLDGSLRGSGDTFRIAARLIRAEDGYLAWSGTYQRAPDEISEVQDEIATAVARALRE